MMLHEKGERERGSFRDPSGYLFEQGGALYRRIESCYGSHFDTFMESGLYRELVDAGLLIPHTQVSEIPEGHENAHAVIQPERVSFISYPYEWSFHQLRDAALTTLDVHRRALKHQMILKDASAFNIQFHRGRATFIDTLSFETYQEGMPWIAYGQFCRHFLAPLALMSLGQLDANLMMRVHLDGIPLDLAAASLPFRSRFKFSLFTHLHMHAKSVSQHADGATPGSASGASKFNQDYHGWLVDSLSKAVEKLELPRVTTEWGDYYDNTSYSEQAAAGKANRLEAYLDSVKPSTVMDLGANTGHYSRLATRRGIDVVACDIDPICVTRNYQRARESGEQNLLPLVMNLANPSPALGWSHGERKSFAERSQVDMVLALALIHHLAISNNLPLEMIAEFFAQLGQSLVIEFVPKQDPMVVKLLRSRDDIFPQYTREGFEAAFQEFFTLAECAPVDESERILYLMHRR